MLSIVRQCELLGISRSGWYYEPKDSETAEDLKIKREIDTIYTKFPYYGVRKMTKELKKRKFQVGKKHVRTLMREMGIEAIYPKPKLSLNGKDHIRFPYLLKDLKVTKPNQVWGTDITYIRLRGGFVYLVAVMDWYSRFVVGWELSNTLSVDFCIQAFENAFTISIPEMVNSDQGVQFTSAEYINLLTNKNIRISMDHRGRCFDNIFVERLWRTVKYEEVYLKEYESVADARASLRGYFQLYNFERIHEALRYETPASVYFNNQGLDYYYQLFSQGPSFIKFLS